jgi:hypothetical protein
VFMNYFEKKLKNPLLFKRALILIKAWCFYESGILGSNIGLLATYALEVLIVYLFNYHAEEIKNEFDAFFLFFKILKEINWEKNILHLAGTCEIDKYNPSDFIDKLENCDEDSLKEYFVFLKQFEKLKEIDKAQTSFKKIFTTKYFNIIDPIFPTNNLGKSVTFHNFSKLKKVFEIGYNDTQAIIKLRDIAKTNPFIYLNTLLKLFQRSLVNVYPELLYLNLVTPKILVNVNNNSLTNDETLEKNSNNFSKVNSLSTVTETMIKDFNTRLNLESKNMVNDTKHRNLTTYAARDIMDYFTKNENAGPDVITEGKYNYEIYYDINIIEKLFKEI